MTIVVAGEGDLPLREEALTRWLDYAWNVVAMSETDPGHYDHCFRLHPREGTDEHLEQGRLSLDPPV